MKLSRSLLLCAASLPLLLAMSTASAQGTSCPELPSSAQLSWETLRGPDYLFCKAMHGDGSQAFAVMLRADSPFRARRALRDGDEVIIDGHEVYWYRGDVPNAIVRETLIEIDRDTTAHITVRASSEEALAQIRQVIQGLHFGDQRLGSN